MQVDAGVDHIKIALDEGYDAYTQSLDLLPLDILSAICDQAHKFGKKVSAHVNKSDKLEILLKAGLTMNQVIKAATLGGAEILGNGGYGKIEENYIADLIAVKGNPYELPYLLSFVNFIMKDGVVIKNV
jgi:imidazolonepropionase-like amidohydrolase